MSRKSLLGIDLTEWNSLSGRVDPYSLELAQISAEAGVPRIALSESSDPADDLSRDPNTGKGGRVGDIKRRQRLANLRKEDPLAAKGPQHAMKKFLRKKGKPVQDDVSFDDCLDAYLEDHGSSLEDFNMLLSLAIENDDFEMQDDLFAIEEALDAILEAGIVQRGKDMFTPGGAPPKAPAGAPAPAAAAAPPPTATPSDAGTAAGTPPPAPTSGAPAPGPDAGATASGAPPSPAKPAVGTTGGNTAQTSPKQPGQTDKVGDPKKKKDPLNPAGMSAGQKLAQGSANVAVSAPAQLAKGLFGKIKKAGSAMKKGYKGEDVDYWEEFLDENDLTIDEYLSVVEQAYEYGDDDMIEEVQQLDEIFAKWKEKKAAAREAQREKVKAGYASARKVIAKHGKEAVKAASVRGVDVPKKVASGGGTTTNEAIDWMLQMSGYTDEYIAEGRSKSQQKSGRDAMANQPVADQGTNDPLATRARIAKKRGVGGAKLTAPSVRQDPGFALSNTGGKKRPKLPEAMEKMLQMSGYTDEYIEARSKEQQWKGQSAAGGETPSGGYRKMAEPMYKKHGVDIDAIDKARKTGKATDAAKRGVRKLRKFNTGGDELELRAKRSKKGKSRLELSTTGRPKLPR
jgi:hypothetical protein